MEFIIALASGMKIGIHLKRGLHRLSTENDPEPDLFSCAVICIFITAAIIIPALLFEMIIEQIISCVFFFSLICISYTDTIAGLIFDRFNILIAFLGICDLIRMFSVTELTDRLIGSLLGAGFLAVMNLFSYMVLKKDGIGGGDIKLCCCAGFLLGYKGMFLTFVLAFFFAAVYVILSGKKGADTFPLGPFLCTAMAAVYCYAKTIMVK
jgi:prepilin signal peptidase PulO-like enzyme (type II secretory pathway)